MFLPDINTDTISPMYSPATAGKPRGMSIGRAEMASMLFGNLRYEPDGRERPDFVLNREPFRRARFVVAGPNFGCGSSRDSAPKMLSAFGVRCVIAPSFGGIFNDNCFKEGVLPMTLSTDEVGALATEAEAGGDFALDVEAQTLRSPSGRDLRFALPAFRREQLITGADDIALTLRRNTEIAAYQQRERATRPWAFLPAKPTR
jgi:3-isopropylmalate/(R)-2-methylmalate dehydratase small subunit